MINLKESEFDINKLDLNHTQSIGKYYQQKEEEKEKFVKHLSKMIIKELDNS